MTESELLAFYQHRLGRLITRQQLQIFEADVSRLNHNVLAAALRATEAFATKFNRPPQNPRQAVLAHYERLSSAIAQLFPVFYLFESSFRPYVAKRLVVIHGGEGWWHEVRDQVSHDPSPPQVTTLGNKPARGEVVRTLAHALRAIPSRDDLTTTYELLELATLGHLEALIDLHWTDMSTPFSGATTSSEFRQLFAKVRKARNDAYHHRVVADRNGVVSAAERLVDLLDVHLGNRLTGMANVQLPPLTFSIKPQPRHN